MSGVEKCLLLLGLLLVSFEVTAQATNEISSYRLGPGDLISIRVLGEDDLKYEKVKLGDAGTISFPVVGEIRVVGKSVSELEMLIADGLRGKYLLNPMVSVTIDEYRSIFVNGQVEKTGAYPYQPGLTVRKAIALAGGFRERASKEKIYVIHEGDTKQTPIRVDQYAAVAPGDIITVEESFF